MILKLILVMSTIWLSLVMIGSIGVIVCDKSENYMFWCLKGSYMGHVEFVHKSTWVVFPTIKDYCFFLIT